MTVDDISTAPAAFATTVAALTAAGQRFAGLYATSGVPSRTQLTALLIDHGQPTLHDTVLTDSSYPSLAPAVPPAFWYERALHDLHGLIPAGHPRLDPLLLPLADGTARPLPGRTGHPGPLVPDEHTVTRRVIGTGLFTIPHGPVRSGVMESVEYLVETPGEDIPFLRLRPYYKHRGIDKHFEGRDPRQAILVAERVEGVATVAHATAYAHAVETLAQATVPPAAAYIRLLHAELERIANHLDVIGRLAEAAGLAVAVARFGWHKEQILRLVGALCGSRFGRGVVIAGGVATAPRLPRTDLTAQLGRLHKAMAPDIRLLLGTSSFLDRLRRTGPLPSPAAAAHGALGPVGRASGVVEDLRVTPGYGAYPELETAAAAGFDLGDALARLRVRVAEIDESLRLIEAAIDRIDASSPLAAEVDIADGRAVGRAEAPHGEVVYVLHVTDGKISRCWPRTASFHNMATFGTVFTGDILTDFPFIEASYGACIAGVAV